MHLMNSVTGKIGLQISIKRTQCTTENKITNEKQKLFNPFLFVIFFPKRELILYGKIWWHDAKERIQKKIVISSHY